MDFTSFSFAILFSIALIARLTIGREGSGKSKSFSLILLALSLIFYGWHRPSYLIVLFVACGYDFYVAAIIDRSQDERFRKRLLISSIVLNLALLGTFKYLGFFLRNVDDFIHVFLPASEHIPHWEIILPIGISFYTFESMSYTIDVYRRRVRPVHSVWKFLLFISFFPHLVAGPIVRARDFLHQIDRKRSFSWPVFTTGAFLMIRGFFLKMVIADNLANIVDKNWSVISYPGANGALALTVVFAFSAQILADFEGYSTIARGAAYLMGYHLPLNFNFPYIAGSFKNFWERWHITLSQWLRDYLYVPLGGNRGSEMKTYRNLFLVMFLGGLWHGASFTYVVWGGIHGLALAIERALGITRRTKGTSAWKKVGWFLVVQGMVIVAWVFFRSPDLKVARQILKNIVLSPYSVIEPSKILGVTVLCCLPIVLGHAFRFLQECGILGEVTIFQRSVLAAAMLLMILTAYGPSSTFIYFQF